MSARPHRQAVWTKYLDHGISGVGTPEERQVLREVLMEHDAYLDTQHRGHAQSVADVKALYEADIPDQPDADLILGSGSAWR